MNQHGGRAELYKQGFRAPRGLSPAGERAHQERPGSGREKPQEETETGSGRDGERPRSRASSAETPFASGRLVLEARPGGERRGRARSRRRRKPAYHSRSSSTASLRPCIAARDRETTGNLRSHATGCLRGNTIGLLSLHDARRRFRRLHA